MDSNKLNICTVTLGTDAKIVNENLIEFNKLYQDVKLYIVCPKEDVNIFKDALIAKNYEIITENELIEFKDFKNIFEELSVNLEYKDEFKNFPIPKGIYFAPVDYDSGIKSNFDQKTLIR